MYDNVNSLSHSKWNCKYHIVFAPKYRRRVIYGQIKKDIGKILDITDCYYCIKIGPNSKKFFKNFKILYFSNSQYPNNLTFFSSYVISLKNNDVDDSPKFCGNCGAKIIKDSKFCTQCGNTL